MIWSGCTTAKPEAVQPALRRRRGAELPAHVMANSMTAARPVAHMWPPWLSFALLCGYAVAALAAGSWALTSRDA